MKPSVVILRAPPPFVILRAESEDLLLPVILSAKREDLLLSTPVRTDVTQEQILGLRPRMTTKSPPLLLASLRVAGG